MLRSNSGVRSWWFAIMISVQVALVSAQTPMEVAIYEIQGTMVPTAANADLTSPLDGEFVVTTGIVTAVNDGNGFYLQDAVGDGDPATSDAIFVFNRDDPLPLVGDSIQITATVSEFYPGGATSGNQPTTQLGNVNMTVVLASGQALPPLVVLGTDPYILPTESHLEGLQFWEALEAMRVSVPNALSVAGTNRFGEIFCVVNNGEGATGISERGTLNIAPDDFNPEKIQIDEVSGIFDFEFPNVNAGDELGNIIGVVGFGFGMYEVYPTESFTGTMGDAGLQAQTTTLQGDDDNLLIATYNVLNLDPNEDDGDTDVADGRYTVLAMHIAVNLNSPDIVALQEVQDDDGSDETNTTSASENLAKLAAEIAAQGGPTYMSIDNTFITNEASGGQPGANIRTAYLYNTDRVTLVDGSVKTISGQAEGEAFLGARLPLVASFMFNGNEVIVIDVHLSSKGGSAPIMGTSQSFEALQEDETVNGSLDERQLQANAIKDYILGLDSASKVVVLGDFNEFEFISPVSTILGTDAGLVNLASKIDSDKELYTFIFQGNSQALDHILVSTSLSGAAMVDYVHVNVEFAELPGRGSDHDPIVASLLLPPAESMPGTPTSAPTSDASAIHIAFGALLSLSCVALGL